jgi:hypothetical protein
VNPISREDGYIVLEIDGEAFRLDVMEAYHTTFDYIEANRTKPKGEFYAGLFDVLAGLGLPAGSWHYADCVVKAVYDAVGAVAAKKNGSAESAGSMASTPAPSRPPTSSPMRPT